MSAENKTFHITTEQIKSNALDVLNNVTIDGDILVSFKTAKETRRDAQLSLKWIWMIHLGKTLSWWGSGFNAEQWNRFFKREYALSILAAQDDEYAEKFRLNKQVLQRLITNNALYNYAKTEMIDAVETNWLTVKNMALFMDRIDEYCSEHLNQIHKLNIRLPVKDEYKWLRENRNKDEHYEAWDKIT